MKREETRLNGYCITAHHAQCPGITRLSQTDTEVMCSCTCH